MSAQNESAQPEPIKLKRIQRPLTEVQWNQARIQFETGGLRITQAAIASIFDTSLSSVQKRSAAEKWSKGAKFIGDARKQLQNAADSAMASAADKAAQEMATRITKELQPWIEKEKRAHIQRAVKRSKRALKRIDGIAEGYTLEHPKTGKPIQIMPGPKDEMCFATAEDKYDNIIRRNLGMNDISATGGTLSLNILMGQAVINQPSSNSAGDV